MAYVASLFTSEGSQSLLYVVLVVYLSFLLTILNFCALYILYIFIYIYIYIYILQLNWICNFIVSLVFPYMNAYLGPYSFFPFAVVLACTFLFALFVLPETQGKTPEEMVALVRTQSQSMSVYEINEDDTSDAINLEWKKAMDELMKEEQQKMNDGSYGTFLLFLFNIVSFIIF